MIGPDVLRLLFQIIAITAIFLIVKRQRWFVVKKGPPPTKKVLIAFTLGVIFSSILISFWVYPEYHKIASIESHGKRSTADVIDISRKCGRGGCRFIVNYTYRVSNVKGAFFSYSGRDTLSDSDAVIAKNDGRVPIAYPIQSPEDSMLNFRDFAFSKERMDNFLSTFFFIGAAFIVVGGILGTMLSNISLRDADDTDLAWTDRTSRGIAKTAERKRFRALY